MPHIKTRDPLRASVPPPNLPGVEFDTDSLARIPVAWTRPQPTTSADTGFKVDPVNDARSAQAPFGSTGTVNYNSTDRQGDMSNPYTPSSVKPNIIPSDDRLANLVTGYNPNPTFGAGGNKSVTSEATTSSPSTGPGTGRDFNPRLARLGNTTTQTPGFGGTTPTGSGLLDQQEQNPSYNPLIDPKRVYGKVWKSRIGQR